MQAFHNIEGKAKKQQQWWCWQKGSKHNHKGGFREGARDAEAPPPPSRFIAPLFKLLAERGSGKSCSSVSLDNLCLMATVEEGVHRSSSSCKKVRWWSIMRVAVGRDLFFFFSSLGKIGGTLTKSWICPCLVSNERWTKPQREEVAWWNSVVKRHFANTIGDVHSSRNWRN